MMAAALLAVALAAAPRVAVPAQPSPTRARYVASREDGLRGLALPSHEAHGWSQRARLLPDGSTEITVVSIPGAPPAARGASRPVLGGPGGRPIDPSIVRLAQEITLGASDPWTASERLLTWVSLNVRHADEPPHDETATATLEAREGSCVGRSVLAAELLRAAGIPARTVHGLLAEPAHGMPFTLHRFVEGWIEGAGWVPSDPGESIHVVDARHVFIATDDGDYDPERQRGLRFSVAQRVTAPLAAPRRDGLRALFVAGPRLGSGAASRGPSP